MPGCGSPASVDHWGREFRDGFTEGATWAGSERMKGLCQCKEEGVPGRRNGVCIGVQVRDGPGEVGKGHTTKGLAF